MVRTEQLSFLKQHQQGTAAPVLPYNPRRPPWQCENWAALRSTTRISRLDCMSSKHLTLDFSGRLSQHNPLCTAFSHSLNLEGIPCGSDGKESACNARDPGSVPRFGRSPGEGYGNPLQYSSLENPMDRGVWWAIVRVVSKSWTWLSKWIKTKQWTF